METRGVEMYSQSPVSGATLYDEQRGGHPCSSGRGTRASELQHEPETDGLPSTPGPNTWASKHRFQPRQTGLRAQLEPLKTTTVLVGPLPILLGLTGKQQQTGVCSGRVPREVELQELTKDKKEHA